MDKQEVQHEGIPPKSDINSSRASSKTGATETASNVKTTYETENVTHVENDAETDNIADQEDIDDTIPVFGYNRLPYVPIRRKETVYFVPLTQLPVDQQMTICHRYVMNDVINRSRFNRLPVICNLKQFQRLYPHIDVNSKRSCRFDGSDLPHEDMASLRFFYNMGLDCVRSVAPHCHITQLYGQNQHEDGFSNYQDINQPYLSEPRPNISQPSTTWMDDETTKGETTGRVGETEATIGENVPHMRAPYPYFPQHIKPSYCSPLSETFYVTPAPCATYNAVASSQPHNAYSPHFSCHNMI